MYKLHNFTNIWTDGILCPPLPKIIFISNAVLRWWFCSPVKPFSLQMRLLQRSVCSGPWQPVSSVQSLPLCYFPWQPFRKTAPDTFQRLSEEKTQDFTYFLAFNIIQMFKPDFVDFFQERKNSLNRVVILLVSWPFPSPFRKIY